MKSQMVLLLLVVVSACAQDSATLRKTYGAPVGEVYRLGDDVMLTTSFNAEGSICGLRVEHETHGRKLTDAELTPLLDQVAPASARGKYIIGTFLDVVCLPDNDCDGVSELYSRMKITKMGNTNEYRYASVGYLRPDCPGAVRD
jgi:hypothetical protein